jgi:hypothetical protein
MKTELIPNELHYLINLVERWGLSDDGYRDEQILNASSNELLEIIGSLPNNKLEILNNWLEASASNTKLSMTDEYINYTCYLMAFEYALEILKKRTPMPN